MALPAHQTKHLSVLEHPIRTATLTLRQSSDGVSTGTGLWLGAQVLSAYLLDTHRPRKGTTDRLKAIELGAGVGMTGLVLASLGYNVLATDVPVVLPILRSNIGMNMPRLPPDAGRVHIRELDWMVPPEDWRWNDTERIASPVMIGNSNSISVDTDYLHPPFDLIVTTDTIYHPDLGDPLLRTLHHLVRFSVEKGTTPRTFLALERRDPTLVDSVLCAAIDKWGFKLEAVPRRRLSKALEKAGMKWPREDWDGVEVWKMSLSSVPLRLDKQ